MGGIFSDEINFDENVICLFLPNVKTLNIRRYQFKSLFIDAPKLEKATIGFDHNLERKNLMFINKTMTKKKPFSKYRYKYMQYIGSSNYKRTMMKPKKTK